MNPQANLEICFRDPCRRLQGTAHRREESLNWLPMYCSAGPEKDLARIPNNPNYIYMYVEVGVGMLKGVGVPRLFKIPKIPKTDFQGAP